jgi:hypothetical protein
MTTSAMEINAKNTEGVTRGKATGSRIPLLLQMVFLQSNRGLQVDKPPPDRSGHRVFFRNHNRTKPAAEKAQRRNTMDVGALAAVTSHAPEKHVSRFRKNSMTPTESSDSTTTVAKVSFSSKRSLYRCDKCFFIYTY